MLTTRGHLITPIFWRPCLCIKYFGIVNVSISSNLLFGYFDHLALNLEYFSMLDVSTGEVFMQTSLSHVQESYFLNRYFDVISGVKTTFVKEEM